MSTRALLTIALLSSSLGCRSADPTPAKGGSPDADSDTDAGSDTDASTDTDADTDTDGAAPTIAPIADARVRLGEGFDIAVEASDPDGDALSFRGEQLPEGASVDAETGTLTWLPQADQVGEHPSVSVIVSDGTSEDSAMFTLQVASDDLTVRALPAMTDARLAPEEAPPSDAAQTLRFTAARGEHEAGRLVVFADADLDALSLDIPELTGPAGTLPADAIDTRTVKLWWQGGTDHALTDRRLLVPELLLKDDTLVRTIGQDNEVRVADGSYADISTPGSEAGRVVVPIDQLDIRDAEEFVPVAVDGGRNKQLWLTLTVPDDQPAGVYTADIAVMSGDTPIDWVPLEVEVLPFDLPPAPITQSIYYRAELDADWPDGSISSEYKSRDQLDAELASMAAHGITNPTVYQPPTDPLFEDVLEARQQAGMDGQPVYLVRGNAHYVGRSLAQLQSETADAIATSQAWGATDVYFMGRDEGREEILTVQREPWEAVRALGGKTWTAGYRTTAWRGPGNFDLMGDIQDLLICAFRPSAEEAALWHAAGHEIFVYENPQGGLEYPELNRRNFGLLVWQEDYDGAMTYAFQDSFGTGWNDFDHVDKRDFNFAYPTTDGVIDTIQYEGYREGVDDTRYLAALQQAMDDAADAGADVSGVTDWLSQLKDAPLARMDLDEIRDHMVGWTMHLQGEVPSTVPALELADLEIGPADRDGTIVVTWTTPRRTRSQIAFGSTADMPQQTPLMEPWVRHHRVALTALVPGEPLVLQVRVEDATGAELLSDVLTLSTGDATQLTVSGPADGTTIAGDVTLDARTEGPWDTSVIIDWDDSLLGWWRFSEATGEDAMDLSAWDHTAVMEEGAGDRGEGHAGNGLWLDGAGEYASAGDLGVPTNGTATVEGWFHFDALAVDHGAPIGLFSGVYIHPVNDHIYFRSTNEWFRSSSHLVPGTWHHIAISWQGDSSTARLWIDGNELPMNVQGDAGDVVALDDFRIGRSFGTMAGGIDELRVWGRALDEAEVLAAHQAGPGGLSAQFAEPGPGTTRYTVYAADTSDAVVTESRTVVVE